MKLHFLLQTVLSSASDHKMSLETPAKRWSCPVWLMPILPPPTNGSEMETWMWYYIWSSLFIKIWNFIKYGVIFPKYFPAIVVIILQKHSNFILVYHDHCIQSNKVSWCAKTFISTELCVQTMAQSWHWALLAAENCLMLWYSDLIWFDTKIATINMQVVNPFILNVSNYI